MKKRMHKYLTCPEARKHPEGEQVRHETLSEWPERKVCVRFSVFSTITVQPSE